MDVRFLLCHARSPSLGYICAAQKWSNQKEIIFVSTATTKPIGMFLRKIKYCVIITLFVIVTNYTLYERYFKFKTSKTSRLQIAATNTSSVTTQTVQQNNVSIFCFVKTHPGNFESRLPKSYNNCIRHCTDYRLWVFNYFMCFHFYNFF